MPDPIKQASNVNEMKCQFANTSDIQHLSSHPSAQ